MSERTGAVDMLLYIYTLYHLYPIYTLYHLYPGARSSHLHVYTVNHEISQHIYINIYSGGIDQ